MSDDELLTARLSLRRPEPADIDTILRVHSDPRTSSHNPSDALRTRPEATGLFEHWDEHWQRFGFGYWVVRRHTSPEGLGFCGLKYMTFRDRWILNLFYRLDTTAWGNGIGSEAAAATVRWAVERLPEYPVIARVRPANVASQRVAERAGLVRAESLDAPGLDGIDLVYAANWY